MRLVSHGYERLRERWRAFRMALAVRVAPPEPDAMVLYVKNREIWFATSDPRAIRAIETARRRALALRGMTEEDCERDRVMAQPLLVYFKDDDTHHTVQ